MRKSTFPLRNRFKGSPARAWVRLGIIGGDGHAKEIELLADTGNPFSVIISDRKMVQLKRRDAPDVETNFGRLHGGWVRVVIPG
jgi:hypothetical protein